MENESMENNRNQLRITCIDFAIRAIGKPVYITDKDGFVNRHQDDVLKLAEKIYAFVMAA